MYQLEKLSSFQGRLGPVLLIIMDGVGIGPENDGNAVFLAKPNTLLKITKDCKERNLFCELQAHGRAVGMISDSDMGNSEVGHNAIGAGQVYDQGVKLVDKSISSGKLFQSDIWKKLTSEVIKENGTTHMIGLLSDGNVHSNLQQIFNLTKGLASAGVPSIRFHILTDGRDVPERSALEYVRPLEVVLKEIMKKNPTFSYLIASGGGRMVVTMDRYESNWKIVQRGWAAHVLGKVSQEALTNGYRGYYLTAEEAITHARECFPNKNDQFLPPFVIIDSKGEPVGKIKDNDLVVNFNFRGDRAIQISKAFEQENFNKFDREFYPKVNYVGLVEYDGDEQIPKKYLVLPPDIKDILSDYCCANKINSFAIAETHKYGHVTYFWNGNRSGYICREKEEYVEIKSDPNEMIPMNPEMKALEVCERTIETLESNKFDFVRVNFANGDMVGHTGILEAAIKSVQIVDECLLKLIDTVNKLNGITIVTADHGNCEEMKFSDGKPKTSHSLNPVGFWIVDKNWNNEYEISNDINNPGLSNIASTILNLLGFEKPKQYRDSLLKFII